VQVILLVKVIMMMATDSGTSSENEADNERQDTEEDQSVTQWKELN